MALFTQILPAHLTITSRPLGPNVLSMTGQKADSPFLSIAPPHSPTRILEPGRFSAAMKPHHCQDGAYVAHSGVEPKLKSLSTTPHQGEFLLSEWPGQRCSGSICWASVLSVPKPPHSDYPVPSLATTHCPRGAFRRATFSYSGYWFLVSRVRNIPSLILFGFQSVASGGQLRVSVIAMP